MKTTILLADDHTLVRVGVKKILSSHAGFAIVGEAGDGQEAVNLACKTKPDVALLDIEMPLLNGLEVAGQIHKNGVKTRVILLTQFDYHDFLLEGFGKEIHGYLLKSSTPEELLWAIRSVREGKTYISQEMTRELISGSLGASDARTRIKRLLTMREIQVFQLIQKGYSSKEIAGALSVSAKTVHTHREHIMTKLELASASALYRYARHPGLRGLSP